MSLVYITDQNPKEKYQNNIVSLIKLEHPNLENNISPKNKY